MDNPFKLRFPSMKLPENYGGRRCVILFAVGTQHAATVQATCIDIAGTPHFNVPLLMAEVREAAQRPICLVEDPSQQAAPMVNRSGGAGLVGPNGQPL